MSRNSTPWHQCILMLLLALLLLDQPFAGAAEPPAFHLEVVGQGQPMILIPGLASSGETWSSTAQHFAPHYACHILTLAGFAGVPPISGPLLATAEAQLVDYIKAQHLQGAVLVGHSLGGLLALRLAADYPDLPGRLVIVDTLPALGAARDPRVSAAELSAAAEKVRVILQAQDAEAYAEDQRSAILGMVKKPADVERIVAWGLASDRTTVSNAMAEVIATDLRQDIAHIRVPTLVLGTWIAFRQYATRTQIKENFEAQYRKLPDVRITLADHARHFIMYDDLPWMLAQIDTFLPQ